MKKIILISLSCLLSIFILAQKANNDKNKEIKWGIGMCAGLRMNYGILGFYYNRKLPDKIEINAGIGVKLMKSCTFGVGLNYPLYNKSFLELLISGGYSYQLKGETTYDADDNYSDYYAIGNTQYLHLFLTSRFYLDKHFYLYINCGYTRNISGLNIKHLSGPNENHKNIIQSLDSGLLLGAGVSAWF